MLSPLRYSNYVIYTGFLLFILIIFELLNLIDMLSKEYLRIIISAFILINSFLIFKKLKKKSLNLIREYITAIKNNYIYAFILVNVLILKLVEGIFIAQNNWDSMSYHLPRYLHWLQNGSLEFFVTPEQRQNISPVLPDYLLGTTYVLFSNDYFIFMIAWISVVVSSFYVYKIINLITINRAAAITGFVVSLFLPSQLAFMSSSQTDPISTTLVVILLYYAMLMNLQKSKNLLIMMILMVPLFITTKTTGLILSLPIYLYVVFKYRKIVVKYLAQFVAIFLLVILTSVPYLLRIMNSKIVSEAGVFVSVFSPLGALTNTLRIFINTLQTPLNGINDKMQLAYYWFTQSIDIDPNPIGFGEYGNFFLTNSLHADFVGNPLHSILLIIAMISLRKIKQYRKIIVLILAQFTLLGSTIGWQPWINRFSSTILVVGSILIGVWIAGHGRFLRTSLTALILAYSLFWIFYNPTRSLLDPKPLIFIAREFGMNETDLGKVRQDLALPRDQQYFSVKPELESEYIAGVDKINELQPKEVYIKINGNDFEYPIWALTDFKATINHFQEIDLIKIQQGKALLFCSVDCDKYELKLLFSEDNITVWGSD